MQKKVLIALLSICALSAVGTVAFAMNQPAAAKAAPGAEVKTGLGIEKYDITGASESFKVAPNTKIYAWAKVSGIESGKVTFAFTKGDKVVAQQELNVPRSPHRTNAYKTFRKGDDGQWTVKVLGPDGATLGSASFKVEISEN